MTLAVELSSRDREQLTSWVRSSSVRAGLAQRARIVLLAAGGVPVKEIVERVGMSKPTVIAWKKHYAAEGSVAWPIGRSRGGLHKLTRSRWCRRRWSRRRSVWG